MPGTPSAGTHGSGRSAARSASVSRQTLLARGAKQLGEGGAQAVLTLALEQPLDPRTRDDHVVVPGLDPLGQLPEGLPDRAPHLVPRHRLADLAPHREAKSRTRALLIAAGEGVEHEEAVAAGASLAIDAVEVAAAKETAAARIGAALGRQRVRGRGACGPSAAGASGSRGRSASGCGHGNRGSGPACASSADRSASSGSRLVGARAGQYKPCPSRRLAPGTARAARR